MPDKSGSLPDENQIKNQLIALIQSLSDSAKSILVLGDTKALEASENVAFLAQDQLDRLAELEQFDFILIQNLIENLPYEKGEHLIAQVRDIHAREMLLILPVSQPVNKADESTENKNGWQPAQLISLGMKQVAVFDHNVHAYYYALETYKKVPDWLNNKYWANPERFNKYRW